MTVAIKETTSWGTPQVEDGVIKNIKLLGPVSKNGNLYPLQARQKAHKLMEGVHVNLDHQKGTEASVERRVGKLVNVHEGEDGTYADFHFLTAHPYAATIVEAAQRMPDVMGFSINGKGTVKKSNKGETIVESIDSLRSVDLVADPGTVKSLFESEEPEAKSVETILGELVAALVSEGKEEFVKDAIKLKKKIVGDGSSEPDEEPEAEESTEESWKAEYEQLKLEKHCRLLLENNSLPVEETLVESLMSMKDDSARVKLMSWHKREKAVKQPRSSEPVAATKKETDWVHVLRSN